MLHKREMFATSKLIRYASSRLCLPGKTFRSACRTLTIPINQYKRSFTRRFPPSLAFSILTLLGLDSETNPEDDLVQTIKFSILYIQREEYERAERLLHVALRQAQQMHNETGVTYIYDVMANLALQRNQLDKAKNLFVSVAQRLMQNGATEDDLRIVHISIKLARVSHLQKEYQTAQTGYEWCISKLKRELSKQHDESVVRLLALAEDWYGKLYVDVSDKNKGVQLLISSQERTRTLKDFDVEHFVIQLNDIGTVLQSIDRLDESEMYFKQAVEKGKELPKMRDLGVVYVNLGRLYLQKGMIDEARRSCGYAWRLGLDNGNEQVKSEAQKCIDEVNKTS